MKSRHRSPLLAAGLAGVLLVAGSCGSNGDSTVDQARADGITACARYLECTLAAMPGAVADGDCHDLALPYCAGQRCVACTGDSGCKEGLMCDDGECVEPPVVCEAGAQRCDVLRLERCDARGLGWELVETCSGGEVCDEERLVCALPIVCAAGESFCDFDADNTV